MVAGTELNHRRQAFQGCIRRCPRQSLWVPPHWRKKRTHLTYRYTLDTLLRASICKTLVDDVTREDILDFIGHCYKLGLGKRTVYDKLVVVLQLFKRHGKTNLVKSGDWPDYVEVIRPIYEAEELEAMFSAATERLDVPFNRRRLNTSCCC